MQFNLNKVTLSHVDKKIGLKLPKEPSERLAEFIGILAGDGYIGSLKAGKDHCIVIGGHIKDDKQYFGYINKELVDPLFGIEMHSLIKRKANNRILKIQSQGLLSFLITSGYQKKHCIVDVPNWIWGRDVWVKSFIKGVFDTDGSLIMKKNHGRYLYYPVVRIALKDKKLVTKIADWLKRQGFSFWLGDESPFDKRTGKIYKRTVLQISGYPNVSKWMEIIGMANDKNIKKWDRGDLNPRLRKAKQKLGFLPRSSAVRANFKS